jgi:hypothetical protein
VTSSGSLPDRLICTCSESLVNGQPPNKRLKLSGPALRRIVRLFASALWVKGRVPCAHWRSPRSLSAIR